MNMYPHGRSGRTVQEIWEDFSMSFTPAVREVVEFAKHIPGFRDLSQHDQVTLLKAGTFEVSDLFCAPCSWPWEAPDRKSWCLEGAVALKGLGPQRLSLYTLTDEGQKASRSCLRMAGLVCLAGASSRPTALTL